MSKSEFDKWWEGQFPIKPSGFADRIRLESLKENCEIAWDAGRENLLKKINMRKKS